MAGDRDLRALSLPFAPLEAWSFGQAWPLKSIYIRNECLKGAISIH